MKDYEHISKGVIEVLKEFERSLIKNKDLKELEKECKKNLKKV